MSLQDDIIENSPKPTYEHDETAKPTVEKETRLDMMKDWIKTCDEHHGSSCVVPTANAAARPTWIIDVVDACVVEGDIAERYLTLSYVWGGVQTLQLNKDNVARLKRHGSLAHEEVALPRTIREALEVTRLLGERYIFVDQLCIVQDDQQHKMTEIQHMGDIYANSYLTLVATTGTTADIGLADCFNTWVHQFPSTIRYGAHDGYMSGLAIILGSIWNRRGWTFQEWMFAGRVLYFLKYRRQDVGYQGGNGDFRISWNCHQAVWHDIRGPAFTEVEQCLDKPGHVTSDPLTWPNFKAYVDLIACDYSKRDFTYDSDVIPAFAGTASALAKTFPGGILYGLPVLFFDIALLWVSPTRRRNLDATLHESHRPPSWSWMTWCGITRGLWWYYFSLGGTKGAVTYPLVQWFYIDAGGTRVRIESDLYRYKHFAQDSESTPPPGWSRTMSTPSKPDVCGELCYVTPCAPGQEFYFPIPLMNTSDAVTIPVPASNKITCRTERAYFFLDRSTKFWPRPKLPALRPFPNIFDATGSISGKMMNTGETPPEGADSITMVELIAISTTLVGEVPFDCEYTLLEKYWPGTRDFYNVLWIEWTDGIAYREAVGFVTKAAWEAADRELIDVVLG